MTLLSVGFFLLAATLAATALWVLLSGQWAALRMLVRRRVRDLSMGARRDDGVTLLRGNLVARWLWRSGIRLTPARVLASVGVAVAAVILAWRSGGTLAAATVCAVLIVLALLWPQLQYRKRVAAMAAQIPLFIDQMVRGLAAGRNVHGALRISAAETRPPLGEVISRVQQAVDLGEDVGEALRDSARIYNLRELHIVAVAMHIAQVYGSSPKEMLESAAKMVCQREQAQRELRALTGEIRFSAWVLSVLPSAVALYMAVMNPDYINAIWHDASGRIILVAALALQATGALILWRMVKSV